MIKENVRFKKEQKNEERGEVGGEGEGGRVRGWQPFIHKDTLYGKGKNKTRVDSSLGIFIVFIV